MGQTFLQLQPVELLNRGTIRWYDHLTIILPVSTRAHTSVRWVARTNVFEVQLRMR